MYVGNKNTLSSNEVISDLVEGAHRLVPSVKTNSSWLTPN